MDYLQKSCSLSSSSSLFSSSTSFDAYPFSIDSELWQVAERRIQEILWIIQPSLVSEQKRKEVIDYTRMLIKVYYSTEVLPFGSVPLKTYLPDGDIDLTALSQPNKEEELARGVFKVLKYKEQDPLSEVRDVRYIEAQVKVVKCCVKDIPIDISFNQIPGLSTLCFLEKVDQLIGKNHLLKRSILLIKAWCFYESRILGAYHGLISTYALEILVLHVINNFHSSLPSPLAVLVKFLEYYSAFDWDNYCVTINGCVAISSLPRISAVSLENTTSESLLTPEFLRSCREQFSAPINAYENGAHVFPLKHLNILDPLKHDNNLGRSVSKGGFNRIKCAFSFGAHRLRGILKCPGQTMGPRLEEFFKNTLDRNGKGERPDAPVIVPAFGTGKSQSTDLSGDYDNYCNSLVQSQWYMNICSPPRSPPSQFKSLDQNNYVFVHTLRPSYASIDQLGKSRGTGTYIPNVHSSTYRDFVSCMRKSNHGRRYYSPCASPLRTREVEAKEIEKKENGCEELSMEEFPVLASHKKCENTQLDFMCLRANEYSASFGGIEFGTYKPIEAEADGVTFDRTMPTSLRMKLF